MPRKIADPTEAAKQPSEVEPNGVVFVKNQTNELIKFNDKDRTTYKFAQPRQLVTNPDLIKNLREAADRPGNPYGIFEIES